MRTIPTEMLAQFKEQQGLNPIFVIDIDWSGVDLVRYSTCEFVDQEVYAYVNEFSNFESISHTEGLGSVSSINVEFMDQFGHFKEKMDTVDFLTNTIATVYITLDGTEFFDLFEGKIGDNFTYKNNIFTIEVTSKTIEKEIGYQPTMDDVSEEEDEDFRDFLSRHLNTNNPWPNVFGTVENYEAPLVWSQRYAEVMEDVHYEVGGELYYQLEIDQVDDFDLDTDYDVNIVGKEQDTFSILGVGQFKVVDDLKVFRLTKAGVHSNWYKNIGFTIIDEAGISGLAENSKTRIELEVGEIVIDAVTLETLGPTGAATSVVWLQFMKLEIRYTLPLGAGTITNSRYVNCVKQSGDICTLNEKLTLPDAAYDVYIRTVTKANDIIHTIPKTSQIYILGDRIRYIVDTKSGTTVDAVKIKNGEELITIDPVVYAISSTALWLGTHPPVTYVYMLAETYIRYIEHFAIKDKESEGILVSAHNTIDTEAEVIEYMSELVTQDASPNTVNFVLQDVEDAQDIIPEVAWQANKGVRFSRLDGNDIIQLIDLTDYTQEPLHTFLDSNVLKNSISYGVTLKDSVYTVFNVDFQTNDMLKELEVIKYKKNEDKYEEQVLDVDYYIFKTKSDAVTRIEFWRDKLSQYYYTIALTGFMDAFALEVWDRVAIELDVTTFYDPALGTPFVNTHEAAPQRWHAAGRIKRASPNIGEGTIDFFIELDTLLGVETDTPYVRHF